MSSASLAPFEKFLGTLEEFLKALEFKYRAEEHTVQRVAAARVWVAREVAQRMRTGDMEPLKRLVIEMHSEMHALYSRLQAQDAAAVAELRQPLFHNLGLGALFRRMNAKTRAKCSQHLCAIYASLALCRTVSEMPAHVWSKVMQASAGLAPQDGGAMDMASLWSKATAMTSSISQDDVQALVGTVKSAGFQSLIGLMEGGGGGAAPGTRATGFASMLTQMISTHAASTPPARDAPSARDAPHPALCALVTELELSGDFLPPLKRPRDAPTDSAGGGGGGGGDRARQRLDGARTVPAESDSDSDSDSDEDSE
jgi:hypothetical protein